MRIIAYNSLVLEASPLENRWELYRVLSEPVRLRLLALAAEEELAIGELAELLGESQPNVSRHAAPLKQAGLLSVRKQGTRALVRLADDVAEDAVVLDALASGRALCDADGSRARIAELVQARDAVGREFFARAGERAGEGDLRGVPSELGAYLALLAPLLPNRHLAIDAGTGDGGLLDILAPTFEQVVAVDRAMPQLARARERVASRGYDNVRFALGELDGAEVREAAGRGADAVFAVRVLHHVPRPADVVKQLAELCRAPSAAGPGGALVVLDYVRHDDEAMRGQADLWLGFEPAELRRFARAAGLEGAHVSPIPASLCGKGPDAHLAWQVLVARRGTSTSHATQASQTNQTETVKKRKANGHG
jgi:DNA-binding transcriptional ArsR family regulator/SAM-dependent methyltransferase